MPFISIDFRRFGHVEGSKTHAVAKKVGRGVPIEGATSDLLLRALGLDARALPPYHPLNFRIFMGGLNFVSFYFFSTCSSVWAA